MRVLFLLVLLVCFSCSQSQKPAVTRDPVKVIFDTDMGSDCDDVGALALLHQYAIEGKTEIVGCIYSSGKVRYGAGVIDAINHYYGKPEIPVGASYDTLVGDPVDKMGAEILANDTVSFGHRIILNRDAHEQTVLNRKLLASSEADNSIVYVTVGHTKGLYDLMKSDPDSISPLSGSELINQKVKRWVALGALGASNSEGNLKKDWNFFFNGTAPYTDALIDSFPRPIYFVDAGSKVMTGKSLAETPEGNIVRQAYTDWLSWHGGRSLSDQRPSWDLLTVYFAVEGLGDYFDMESKGSLSFDSEAGCIWDRNINDPLHHIVTQKPGLGSLIANDLNKKISLYRPR